MRPYGYNRAYGVWDQWGTALGTKSAKLIARKRARLAGTREIETEDWHPDLEDYWDWPDDDWNGVPDLPPPPPFHTIAFKLRAAA